MENSKTAIVVGATGLIGNYLVQELINNSNYVQIKVHTRRPTELKHKKVVEIITNFSNKEELSKQISGDELFCCLGTTIKKAGSHEAFRKVDFELPLFLAQIARANNVSKMLVVSSLGADKNSNNFYLRTKGEMESAITALGFEAVKFFRPSMLLGPRKESRPAETVGKILMQLFGFLLIGTLSKYKAIHAKTVAVAMIKIANSTTAEQVFESDKIEEIAK